MLLAALLTCGWTAGVHAKLPAPTDEQSAKAAEAKAKAADAAKRDGELLAKSQDRVAEHYKRTKAVKR